MDNEPQISELIEEVTKFLALNPNTGWLGVPVVDINGIVRGKRYPRAEMENVFRRSAIPEAILPGETPRGGEIS